MKEFCCRCLLFIVTDVERFLSRKQENRRERKEQQHKRASGEQSRYLIVDLQKIPLLKFPGCQSHVTAFRIMDPGSPTLHP
ncbi:hypothetical protein CEXT_334571 [Caerostris extrusa]|uniref:Uncharacterized protein n=1 Tax=Caerostris extrusa TaxID=172846 RepID=A0AAV4T4E0_CAEEX|nr:hypothetical protein CEXT_334571 [Caerostris extrusa]